MNDDFYNNIWVLNIIILFPLVTWYIFEIKRLVSRLKDHHNSKWKELGAPSLIMNNSIGNTTKLSIFLLRNDYKKLDDDVLTKKGNLCRYLLISGFILSVSAFIFPIVVGKYWL